MVDVVDMKLNDVVKLIRGKARHGGPAGGHARRAAPRRRSYNITRAKIELKDSEARGEIFEAGQEAGRHAVQDRRDRPAQLLHGHGRRPARRLPDFKSTTRDVPQASSTTSTRKGVDAVVLDLRHNGGGSLTEAINLTGLFIDDGPGRAGQGRRRPRRSPTTTWSRAWPGTGPLVVLTSKFSASASEILAGAIQDYGRGLIVGDHSTHGKGTVQSLLDLGQQLFRMPNAAEAGRAEDHHAAVLSPQRRQHAETRRAGRHRAAVAHHHLDVGEADLDYAVEFDQRAGAGYGVQHGRPRRSPSRWRRFPGPRLAIARICQADPQHRAVQDQKAKKLVSLKEKEFFAERAELDAEKEEEKQLEEHSQQDQSIKRDYYLNEALAITADYVRLLQQNRIAWLR